MATTTSQNYTDQDIVDALRIAAQDDSVRIDIEEGERYIAGFEITDLRRFLNALPDQQYDWEECPMFGAPEPGDRLRIRWACGDVHEGVITSRSRDHIQLDSTQVNRRDKARLEYTPAPVVHPDPAKHPVIIVHLHNGVKETKRAFVWNGESYGCLDGPHSFLAPHQITEWSPAKVVANND